MGFWVGLRAWDFPTERVLSRTIADPLNYEHNARSGGTPAAPREKDLVWRLVAGGVG